MIQCKSDTKIQDQPVNIEQSSGVKEDVECI